MTESGNYYEIVWIGLWIEEEIRENRALYVFRGMGGGGVGSFKV